VTQPITLSSKFRQQNSPQKVEEEKSAAPPEMPKSEVPIMTTEPAADNIPIMYESANENTIKRSSLRDEPLTSTDTEMDDFAEFNSSEAPLTITTEESKDVYTFERPLTEHPDRVMIEKMLNLIEEEDIPEFIASIRERFVFTMTGEHGIVVGKSVIAAAKETKERVCCVYFVNFE
jgi:hypothetical protein